jgi:hypothetical protein
MKQPPVGKAKPELKQFGLVAGLITAADLDKARGTTANFISISGLALAEADIGTFEMQFSALCHWQGKGGPWAFTYEVVEEPVSGSRSKTAALFSVTQMHTFPEGNPDLVTPIAISFKTPTYGSVVVNVFCGSQLVRSQRLEIVRPGQSPL